MTFPGYFDSPYEGSEFDLDRHLYLHDAPERDFEHDYDYDYAESKDVSYE